MSTPYQVYKNRPIDQWKVTELKDELRRRKLKINGLKEELVRRLDESLRSEMETASEDELGNECDPDDHPQNNVNEKDSGLSPAEHETELVEQPSEKVDNDASMVDVGDISSDVNQGARDPDPMEVGNECDPDDHPQNNVNEKDSGLSPVEHETEHVEQPSEKVDNDASIVDVGDISSDVNIGTRDPDATEVVDTKMDVAIEATSVDAVSLANYVTDGDNVVAHLYSNDQDPSYDEKTTDSKPPAEDAELTAPDPTNQVSEVSPDLGFQVKCESISTDSVSINEKNELKDNLNANNVHLELEVVKTEMVQPSSTDVPTVGVNLHPIEDDKELVDNQVSLEEVGEVSRTSEVELCKKVDCVDGGSPEKLNLDRSSGDESMEEDVLENKQIESKNSYEVGQRRGNNKPEVLQMVNQVDDVVGGLSPEKKGMVFGDEITTTTSVDKRKAEDQEPVAIIDTKRQRRWNLETSKGPEQQTCTLTATTPKDAFQPSLKRSLSRNDSSLGGEAPKERVVPPPLRAATTSLRINNFLRPFTLKAVQELLAKTGTFSDFWMDHIKTHCYVTYSSAEEAVATRNAVYNLQWPTNGGRLLTAEFVDPQEVKSRLDAPQPSTPVTPSLPTPIAPPFPPEVQDTPPLRHQNLRGQKLPPPPPLPPPPALSDPPPVRERLPLPPPPPPLKKPEPPIVTLDDLFKKTKATPRIYYLPLSKEQVDAKLAAQGKPKEGH